MHLTIKDLESAFGVLRNVVDPTQEQRDAGLALYLAATYGSIEAAQTVLLLMHSPEALEVLLNRAVKRQHLDDIKAVVEQQQGVAVEGRRAISFRMLMAWCAAQHIADIVARVCKPTNELSKMLLEESSWPNLL